MSYCNAELFGEGQKAVGLTLPNMLSRFARTIKALIQLNM
jgi:hypothetical protein